VYLHQILDLLKLHHYCTSSERKKISPKHSKYLYITIGYENLDLLCWLVDHYQCFARTCCIHLEGLVMIYETIAHTVLKDI
jgi:hypothetical protein